MAALPRVAVVNNHDSNANIDSVDPALRQMLEGKGGAPPRLAVGGSGRCLKLLVASCLRPLNTAPCTDSHRADRVGAWRRLQCGCARCRRLSIQRG